MVACHIMPGDAITVHIVKNCKTRFICSIDIKLCIVRLANLFVSSLTPGIEAKTVGNLVGRGHLLACGWPEPTIDVLRLQVTAILATLEVTEATTGPDVWNISCEVKMVTLLIGEIWWFHNGEYTVSIFDRQIPPFQSHQLLPCSQQTFNYTSTQKTEAAAFFKYLVAACHITQVCNLWLPALLYIALTQYQKEENGTVNTTTILLKSYYLHIFPQSRKADAGTVCQSSCRSPLLNKVNFLKVWSAKCRSQTKPPTERLNMWQYANLSGQSQTSWSAKWGSHIGRGKPAEVTLHLSQISDQVSDFTIRLDGGVPLSNPSMSLAYHSIIQYYHSNTV